MTHKRVHYDGVDSIREAREWADVVVQMDGGGVCPCCDRNLGYEFSIQSLHAKELMRLRSVAQQKSARNGEPLTSQAIHVPTELGSTATTYSSDCLPPLRHLGLVTQAGPDGWWKLTPEGVRFLEGELSVPKSVWLFRSELVRVIKERGEVFVHDLVSDKEYEAGMSDPGPEVTT